MPDLNEGAELDTSQVEDMRGGGGGGGGGFGRGGGFPIPLPGGRLGGGIAGLVIMLILGYLGYSGNLPGLSDGGSGNAPAGDLAKECAVTNEQRFDRTDCRNLAYVNSIQAYWKSALPETLGQPYQMTTTRFFSDSVSTSCGQADSGIGPFYCPADSHVYIDLTFYDELSTRFGASGQFAEAYVIAHEYGHHIQNVVGTSEQVHREQQRDPANANQLSIRLELQADCFAGAWATHAAETTDLKGNKLFESVTDKDIAEALQAAAAVGDDAIQKKSGRGIDQESWTHGSSEQRQRWFTTGFESGDPRRCDTFSGGA
ncbi:MAG: KPN_02809 family neutral zinc metallopeptidase [Micromonosporaceae bacterium]